MQFRNGLMTAIAGGVLLTGCANWDVDGTAALPNQGDAFAKALQDAYIERAKFEVDEVDWVSVDFFTSRAELAAKGMPPAPQSPSERNLELDQGAIEAGYANLTKALAAGNAKMSPVACAQSQAWLEHWMEQAEEGHQMDDIKMARTGFEKAIPHCMNKVEMPTYSIYFPFNGSKLTKEAKSIINTIVGFFKGHSPNSVTVAGHTDTAGSASFNMDLGQKRAASVAKALGKKGVSPITEISYGETNLPKPTPDGVREPKNRQVKVTFK